MGKLVKEAWDLEVYKLAYRLSLEIHKITKQFPKDELFSLTNQMRRCSKSICANLAEGFAKQEFSNAEFKRFVTIAIGSSAEMRVWIQYCQDLEYVDNKQSTEWHENYQSVSRMLRKFHASI